jgi:ubiquinone/menaquinone biosynthesis C-methylase UbiE
MLQQAAARSARLRLVQGDACRLPFADRSFDAVVCTEAFHWFPFPADALAECFRVLRPGGRLLLAVTSTPAVPLSRMIYVASRLLGEAFYWPSRAEARRWLEHAGFRITSQRRVARIASQLLPPILTVAARPRRPAPASRRAPQRRHPIARRYA